VGIFPNDASITRLVGAMMLEQNDESSLNRRYMQLEGLQTVRCYAGPARAARDESRYKRPSQLRFEKESGNVYDHGNPARHGYGDSG
jgi:hypothetical protein